MAKLRLHGKIAIITGAASGIGEATARLFVEHGAFVVIGDIQDELGQKVVSSIDSDKIVYKHCDIRDESQVQELILCTIQKYGSLDIMFSNAGIMGSSTRLLEMDMASFDESIAINLRGSALLVKYAGRAMVENNIRGSIICTGSVSATAGANGPFGYTVCKHAILGIVRAAASELGKHGIRVNCVSPSGVATPLSCATYNSPPSEIEMVSATISGLKGIILKTEHVAEAALFLASDESVYINGHNLAVDGGVSSMNTAFLAIWVSFFQLKLQSFSSDW
ncbi:short-chain dehydrogenase reductase 3b-like [Heracleum sosnowskyi]|uniref:Short-chain dehydrogenase reductase 3b-like n=1 Tax=Heracleum sosnowskyi TaxID=360622 RepID=A0AAD8LZT3_9APIA|nr:short-chain dehydrogenase reductase 3b-like [Heracleum sosnowskyi]